VSYSPSLPRRRPSIRAHRRIRESRDDNTYHRGRLAE
jgi:hypothetical protein